MEPKLSVIIPSYNAARYLGRCLDSLLNQTLKNCEIIVVDDGSCDESREKTTEYMKRFPQVSLVESGSHLGTGAVRNIGLSHASGDYIAFLDADDWVDTDTYRRMCAAMESANTDIAVCGIRTEFGAPSQSVIRYQYPEKNIITGNFALKLLCRTEMQDAFISPMPGNKVFRADFLRQHQLQFPPRRLWEDDVFMFLAFLHAEHISVVAEVYQHYYQHDDSSSHLFSKEHIDSFLLAFCEIRDALKQNNMWEMYQREFYAYMDRGLSSLLDVMFSKEQRVSTQQAYLTLLLNGLIEKFSMQELLSHMDPKRLCRVWL